MSKREPKPIDYPQEKLDAVISTVQDKDNQDTLRLLIEVFLKGGGGLVKTSVMKNFLAAEKSLGRRVLKSRLESVKQDSTAMMAFNLLKTQAHIDNQIKGIRTDSLSTSTEEQSANLSVIRDLIDGMWAMYVYEMEFHDDIWDPKRKR